MDDRDGKTFEAIVSEGVRRFDHKVHAYCSLPRVVRLVIQAGTVPLSRVMQSLAMRYTRHVNHRYGRSGPLFQGRYRAVLVDAESYLVPLVRYASINGIPVMELLEQKYGADKAKEVMQAMVERTKQAGGEVVKLLKTGSAFYSPASSAIAMAESILKDQKRVLPTCAMLKGEFGVDGYYVGVPCVLGTGGVERVLELDFDEGERKLFEASVEHVRGVVSKIEL